VASLIVGGTVVHAVDQRHAHRLLYDIHVLTTASRFLDEERSQIALPVAQRNAGALADLADSINADLGVNSEGTLQVTTGTGSAATFTQIAFEVTVSSPYASTTFAVWTAPAFVRSSSAPQAGRAMGGRTVSHGWQPWHSPASVPATGARDKSGLAPMTSRC
jgi:hypothetical protein